MLEKSGAHLLPWSRSKPRIAEPSLTALSVPISAGCVAGGLLRVFSVHSGEERGSAGLRRGRGWPSRSFLSKNRRKQIGTGSRGPSRAHIPDDDVSLSSRGCGKPLWSPWVLCTVINGASLPPVLPSSLGDPSGPSLQHLRLPPSLLFQTHSPLQGPSPKLNPPAAHAL